MAEPERPRVSAGSDPRLVRVERGDGQVFELPRETATALGLEAPVGPAQEATAPPPPAVAGPSAPITDPGMASAVDDAARRLMPGAGGAAAPGVADPRLPIVGILSGQPAPAPPSPTDPRPGETFAPIVRPAQPVAASAPPPAPPRRRRREPPAPPEPPTEEELNQQTVDALLAERERPLVPEDMRTSSPLERQVERIAEGERLVREQAHSEAVAAAERQDLLIDAQRQQAELERERQAALTEAQARYQQAFEAARTATINPHRLLGNAAGLVGVAIATALSGIGAALTGGPNRALETIERAIDRDIAAQESNAANLRASADASRTFLDIARQSFSDEAAAQEAARSLAWAQVAERAAQQAAQIRDQGAALRARELEAEARQRAEAAQQAAIVAQQDRELALNRELLEQRKLAAEAARLERRAAGVGGRRQTGSPYTVPQELMGTDQDPAFALALQRGYSPDYARLVLSDDRGGARSPRNRLLSLIGEGEQQQQYLPGGIEPIDPLRPPMLTVNDRNVISTINRVEAALEAASSRFENNYRILRDMGLLATGASVLFDKLPGVDQGRASRALREMNASAASLRSNIRRVLDESSTQAVSDELHHHMPEVTWSNIEQAADAFRANLAAKSAEAEAALAGIGYRFVRGRRQGEAAPPPQGVRPRQGGGSSGGAGSGGSGGGNVEDEIELDRELGW